ncbi:protein-L-isoaspartate(D-aspartate) O-methyltransferase [candidate division KSB1 bacterium]|nr:protein-L-isoaspartate(D-aspartate) O-methyltransferase [candidate division KSB1 bacterium]RQW01115.1 MAG: protein-L-isoaspartate(D-aspartate) O-methyltransferase [candidate division KSB1 bacterium]
MRISVLLLTLACIINCKENMSKKQAAHIDFEHKRHNMVAKQIISRGVSDNRVLKAMRSIPREKFVLPAYMDQAYEDYPLPIGYGQTISQPYIVAYMTEVLQLDGTEKVLEIGTGSGYQAAVLSECAAQVFTIEIVEPLCNQARELLADLNYDNVHVRCGDGFQGWPEEAPFDAIIVTAAPPDIPPALMEQLAHGGRMIIPVGKYIQHLKLLTKDMTGMIAEEKLIAVRFVPMTGGK